jgi:flagellar motility protein MotE (MotC chaperone)
MSGTDVAKENPPESAESAAPAANVFLTFLRIWLPFPLMLGAVLLVQLRLGDLRRAKPEEEAGTVAFEGAGADLPALLQTIVAEREAVQKEREELGFASRRILLEQSEISARQREVEDLLQRVESQFGTMEKERDTMLTQLATVYETMKASAAAEILTGLEVETSTEILRRMKERKAAEILAKLPPDAAAKISQTMLRTRRGNS